MNADTHATCALDSRRAAWLALNAIIHKVYWKGALPLTKSSPPPSPPASDPFSEAIVLTVIRRLGDIDHTLKSLLHKPSKPLPPEVANLLRMLTAQILLLNTPAYAAGETTMRLVQRTKWAGFRHMIHATAHALQRQKSELCLALAQTPEKNLPPWMVQRWRHIMPWESVLAYARCCQHPPPIDVSTSGPPPAHPHQALPSASHAMRCVRMHNSVPIPELLQDGSLWVQDFAAALPAMLTAITVAQEPLILDLCAAPGGKTMQLASMHAHTNAQVVAVDLKPKRILTNLKRTGLKAHVIQADILDLPPTWCTANFGRLADAILLDAPCSATGILRRHPDVRLHRRPSDIETAATLQSALIKQALPWLKPGGVLIYAVCSLEPEEGALLINTALGHTDCLRKPFQPQGILSHLGLEHTLTPEGDVLIIPPGWHGPQLQEYPDGMDGFFIAQLQRPR